MKVDRKRLIQYSRKILKRRSPSSETPAWIECYLSFVTQPLAIISHFFRRSDHVF